MARIRKKAVKVEEKPKKKSSEFQDRARAKNLEKAREVNRKKKYDKDMAKMEGRLEDLSDDIDGAVDKQVGKRLKKFDRKKLKDEVLQIFYDMGGTRAMKKWAKDNPGKYYSLMKDILKADTEKEGGGGGGVTVNLFGLDPSDMEIDVTPDKP